MLAFSNRPTKLIYILYVREVWSSLNKPIVDKKNELQLAKGSRKKNVLFLGARYLGLTPPPPSSLVATFFWEFFWDFFKASKKFFFLSGQATKKK